MGRETILLLERMQPEEVATAPDLQEYTLDGRQSISQLYAAYLTLVQAGWELETMCEQPTVVAGQNVTLPTIGLKTKNTGPALWLLAGIHGEEPAGPNAITRQITVLEALGQKAPVVVLPLCNPEGYRKGWRYPDEARDWQKGHSVSDAEHYLPSREVPTKARVPQPASANSRALTATVLRLAKTHPPRLVIDLHEHEHASQAYLYAHGSRGASDPVARELVALLQAAGVALEQQGKTRFGEDVTNGIVSSIHDGSLAELFASPVIIVDGQSVQGPDASSVIVFETPASQLPLSARVDIHARVIAALEKLWGTVPT